jgi:hypothetical protein
MVAEAAVEARPLHDAHGLLTGGGRLLGAPLAGMGQREFGEEEARSRW